VTEVGVIEVGMHGLALHGGRGRRAGAVRTADLNWKL